MPLCDRIEQIDPCFGIEKLSLAATMIEPLEERQAISSLVEDTVADVTPLLDVLGNRGGQRLYRLAPVPSDVPERDVQMIRPAAEEGGASWPSRWPRPVRLFLHPEEIEVIALTPDHPPHRSPGVASAAGSGAAMVPSVSCPTVACG